MTTITVNLDGLRELAAFRAEKGCAISLYVDLDPSVSPTSGAVATRVRSLLDVAAKSHGATRPDLAHEVKSGLKEDFERLDQYFDGAFDRDGARGLAVFAAGPDNVWSVLSLPSSVPDAARVADDFLIAPLVPLLGRGNGVIVAAVGREQGRVLELRGGRLQEIADRTEDTPAATTRVDGRRRGTSGISRSWSTTTTSRSSRRSRTGTGDSAGPASSSSAATRLVRSSRRRCRPRSRTRSSAGRTPRHTPPARTCTRSSSRSWRSGGPHGRARWSSAGAKRSARAHAALRAGETRSKPRQTDASKRYSIRRVPSKDAYRCPSCGRAAVSATTCPLDGTRMEPRDDGLDIAVRLTLAHGGDVLAVEHRQDLDPVDGIGAILRY